MVVNNAIQISRYLYRCTFEVLVSVSVSPILLEKSIDSVSAILFEAKKEIDTFIATLCPMVRRDTIYCQVMVDSVRSNVLFLTSCLLPLPGFLHCVAPVLSMLWRGAGCQLRAMSQH